MSTSPARTLADRLDLASHLSEASLERLLSEETANRASQMTSIGDLQSLLNDLDLTELTGIVVIDDGQQMESEGWGGCFGDPTEIAIRASDHDEARFLPKAPGGDHAGAASAGAQLGAAVGAAFTAAVGAAGVSVGAPVGAAIGASILVGAAAGAVGAGLSSALRD